jgi:hypothetical protein
LATSRSVSQPLADDATDRALSALYIVHAKSDSIAVFEIELGEVTVKMFLADVLIDAIDSAFQDREVIFGGIGGGVSPYVFLLCVIDCPGDWRNARQTPLSSVRR